METGYSDRFGGVTRLFGKRASEVLQNSHVCVIGIGGVGTWVAEALARSGVGSLTLVDPDEICVTNTNRQLHCLTSTIGISKVQAMKGRVLEINPDCQVRIFEDFFDQKTFEQILDQRYDYVVDAIDRLKNKILAITACKERDLPLIIIGGAGGKSDPGQVQIQDLAKSYHDPLLLRLRKKLRRDFGYPRANKKMKIPCVFSSQKPVYALESGEICQEKTEGMNLKLDCHTGMGTASFITGTFGFFAANHVIREILNKHDVELL